MVKRRKKSLADAVYAKKSVNKPNPFAVAKPATAKHLNPFEVHVNKEKFRILGRTCKHDRGLPGISRSKASKKRKETLGKEYMEKYKSNKFVDRRIGKHINEDKLNDDILNARFVADKFEELQQHKHRKSRFNLNEDEILTHHGQTLEEIEHIRDERSDDDDNDQENYLNAEFTELANFGEGGDKSTKDRKQVIEEMIVEQKKRKIEIAKEKDAIFDLTEKLDSNYKNLINLMNQKKPNNNEIVKEKPPPDDYDKLMRELIFEPRGAVTDKLKTEETELQKNQERLKKLEEERIKRMSYDYQNGTIKMPEKIKHRSADALDESYYSTSTMTNEKTLAYNAEGKLHENFSDERKQNNKEIVDTKMNEGEEESKDGEIPENNSNLESADEAESGDEMEGDDNEDEDDLSDLKVTDSDSDSDSDDHKKESNIKLTKQCLPSTSQKVKNDKQNVTIVPFIVVTPDNYEEFQNFLNDYDLNNRITLIKRLMKCNQSDLEHKNKQNSNIKLFTFLLQLVNDKFVNIQMDDFRQQFDFLSKLMPVLYDLIQLDAKTMSTILLNIIKQKYKAFCQKPKNYPSLEVLIIFKLVSNLCCTSDYRHPLVTPCFIFMQHILSTSKIQSSQDIAKGLFLVTLCLEYTMLSKRVVPEVFTYILGIISLAISKKSTEITKIIPQPFGKHSNICEMLVIETEKNEENRKKISENLQQQQMTAEDLICKSISYDFKIRCLNTCLKLAHDAAMVIKENVGTNFLAEPLLKMLSCIPLENYPNYVNENYIKTRDVLKSWASKPLIKLMAPEKKPKALRLLEPRIEPVYDDKRRPKLPKAKEERIKLLHKVKRETKGAIREIRRDTEFLQKIRIQQQLQSDKERQEKVKRIYAEAAMQQSELNALDRAKKRKKF